MEFRRRGPPSVLVERDGGSVDFGLADQSGGVAKSGEVGAPSEEETGLVIGQNRGRPRRAVHGLSLGKVLEDRHQLNALPRGTCREGSEALEWCDVRGLIQDDEKRRVKGSVSLVALRGGIDDLLQHRHEQAREAFLLVDWSARVKRVLATIKEQVWGDVCASRARKNPGVLVGLESVFGGRVDTAEFPGFAVEARLERVQGVLVRESSEDLKGFSFFVRVDPPASS